MGQQSILLCCPSILGIGITPMPYIIHTLRLFFTEAETLDYPIFYHCKAMLRKTLSLLSIFSCC